MSSPTRTRDWNAGSYDELATPHVGWGEEVLGRLALRGDETVLDLGCGTGHITRRLLERLPRGRVVAVDGSQAMARRARAALGERATVICSDLLALRLDEPADAAISTATFHWIADHDALFARIHDALVPGAQFVAQCGGAGNVASLAEAARRAGAERPFAAHLGGWEGPWNYATPEQTAGRLERAGFDVERCWLRPDPVTPERPREFVETIALGSHLERLPERLRAAFVDRVIDRMPRPLVLDYVRLNLVARRR